MSCFRLFASALLALLLLYPSGMAHGAGRQAQNEVVAGAQPQAGGTYRIPLLNEPPTLDPAFIEDTYGLPVAQQIFEGLVQFSPELFVIPGLAQNWRMEEGGRVYRFSLRSDVRFHNGRPLTSRDVVFSLSRLIRVNPSPSILPHLLKITGAGDYREQKTDRVVGIEAEGDYALVVRLDEPYTPFLAALGMLQAKVVPQEEVVLKGNAFGRNPVGSGPFQLASWEENRSIRLQRFADYPGNPPYLQEIQFRIYAGGRIEEVLTDFQQGKLEEMPVYWQFRDRLLGNQNLQWVHRPSLSLLFYGVNCQHPVLRNPLLRKALAAAIDRRKIISEVYQGQFEPAITLLPPGMPGYQPQSRKWLHDMELAKDLAKRALGPVETAPLTVELVSNSQSPLAQAELNLVRDAWGRLGIKMEQKFIPDWAQFERYLRSDALQIYRYAWTADMPDPDSFLQPLLGSSSQVNFMRYRSEGADALLGKTSRITDPIERARLCQQLEDLVAESVPLIPLFYLSVDRVYQPSVRGIAMSALGEGAVSFLRVWLKGSSEP
jgi:ABC-type transport system substrate-binding protein